LKIILSFFENTESAIYTAKLAEILHPHDLVPAINVNDLPGDRCGAIGRKEKTGRTKFFGGNVAFKG
jgi:hypothetical protein